MTTFLRNIIIDSRKYSKK